MNRFESVHLEVLGEHLDREAAERPDERQDGVQVPTTVLADRSRRVINHVDSPDLSFRWTLNPYRGCEHGCIYCYARPTHETLGFSCGLEFETKIVAKPDAPRLLRRELAEPRWRGEPIVMSGVTDPYQPLESRLGITRGCLEVMAACRQPVTVVTKSRLVCRDADLLGELARREAAAVAVSLTTLDPALAGTMEPRAGRPVDRLRAIAELSAAGIPVTVMVAPVIPGLNDSEIPAILKAAAEAGAGHATWVMLRLPHQVGGLFLDWLRRSFPDRAPKVERLIRDCRGGALYDHAFGRRARGEGPRAEQIRDSFVVFARRYGLHAPPPPLSSAAFRRPEPEGQMAFEF